MSDPLADLLALERSYDDLPEGADGRILARVESAVAGEPGDGGDGGGHSGGDPAGRSGPSTPAAAAATKGVSLLARAAYLAVGLIAGAGGHAALVSGTPRSRPEGPIAAAPTSSVAVALVAESPAPVVVVESLPSAPAAPASSVTLATRRDDKRIRDERADLDVARTALSLGRVQACLESIDRHTRTYGEGHFAEEREVLAVQALAGAGRNSEAAARALRFRQKYPTSLFGPAMTQSLPSP